MSTEREKDYVQKISPSHLFSSANRCAHMGVYLYRWPHEETTEKPRRVRARASRLESPKIRRCTSVAVARGGDGIPRPPISIDRIYSVAVYFYVLDPLAPPVQAARVVVRPQSRPVVEDVRETAPW